MNDIDWRNASKERLLEKLLDVLRENERLNQSVSRLMKSRSYPTTLRYITREDDFVQPGWAERYGIDIPRADGFHESSKAWIRVTRGVITNAGIKNQSILSMMVAREMLDTGAERHALLYMDWRAAFFARVEAARYSDHGTGDPEAWGKEDRYSKLIKAVEKSVLRYVDAMVTANPKEKDVAHVNDDPQPFIEAFSKTARAMNRIGEDADEALKAKRSGVNVENPALA